MRQEATAEDWPLVMTPEQAAVRLGLCVDTIYDAIRERALPHKRIGRRIFIVRDKLIAWLCE